MESSTPIACDFATLLKQRQEALGITATELALRVHKGLNTVSEWRSGHRLPAMTQVALLAQVLGVDAAELRARLLAERAAQQGVVDPGQRMVVDCHREPVACADSTESPAVGVQQ
jgi:transcriptional regulator with XRE-family HTH domain